MSDRQELEELRRLDELERKAAGSGSAPEVKGNGGAVSAPAIPTRPWHEDLNAGIASGASRIAAGVLKPFIPEADWQQMEQQGGPLSQAGRAQLNQMADTPLGTAGSIGMDIATTAALPFGAAARVPQLSKALAARGALPAAARTADVAATQAGIGAAISPDDRASGAKWGAAGGAGGQVLGRVLGGIVRPTDEARVLMDKGVALTPGQAAGTGSLANRIEQSATSLPLAGHAIKGAQRRAVEDANVAAAQSVVKLVDENIKLGRPPREAIEQTRDAISKHYDSALAGLTAPTMTVGRSLEERVPGIIADNPMMTAKAAKQLERYVSGRFQQIISGPNGADMTGDMLKQLDSEIGGQIRNLQSSLNASDKTAAPAWRELQVELRDVMKKHATDGKNEMLNQANNAYRQLLALEKAMLPGADTFTPRRLRASLENAKLSGTGLNQVADAMSKTLPNNVPDSGTAERLLTAGLPAMLGVGGVGASNMGYDTLGAGMLLGSALGSRTGAKAMTGSLPMQQAIAAALRRGTPSAVRAGGKKDD